MPEAETTAKPPRGRGGRRVLSGFALALTIAFSAFMLFSFTKPGGAWFGSLWFLALLPGVLCALICYIGDPDQDRPSQFYWQVPLILVGVVVAGSLLVLHEGVICAIMLSPIWLGSGWAGAFLLRSQRARGRRRTTLQSSFLVIPLMAAVVEAQIPAPHEPVLLTRSILVRDAPGEAKSGLSPHRGEATTAPTSG